MMMTLWRFTDDRGTGRLPIVACAGGVFETRSSQTFFFFVSIDKGLRYPILGIVPSLILYG